MSRTPFLIHIDTNIPIYAAGRQHSLKAPCQEITRIVAAAPQVFASDAEVLQGLLHYYRSGNNWAMGRLVYDAFVRLAAGRICAVSDADVTLAATLVGTYPRLSARDRIHLAVVQRTSATHIVTADRDFDGIPGLQRLEPAHVAIWRTQFGL